MKNTNSILKPLSEILGPSDDWDPSEGWDDTVDITKEAFLQMDFATLPENSALSVCDDDVNLQVYRVGEKLFVGMEDCSDIRFVGPPHHAAHWATATLNAIRILCAEGRPFSSWDFNEGGDFDYTVTWHVAYDVGTTGAQIVERSKAVEEEVTAVADAILSHHLVEVGRDGTVVIYKGTK